MSTSLKRLVGMLVAGVALSLAILATLPGLAEAQDTDWASTQAEQNTTTDDTGALNASRPAPEPSARLMVDPGDSLWSISQEQIGSGATPQQILYEVERIFEFNRDRIGDDPNLIFPGQELLLEPVVKPAAPEEPGASKEPVVFEEPVVSEEPVAAAESATSARTSSLTLALVTFGVLLLLLIFPVYAGIALHRWVVQPSISMLAKANQTGEDLKGRSGPARERPEIARGPSGPAGTEDAEPASASESMDASLAASRRQGGLRRIHQRPPRQRRRPKV